MDRAGRLAVPEQAAVPLEVIVDRGRHRQAGEDLERRQDEDHTEVGELLKGVVTEEAVGLDRQVKGHIVDVDGPSMREERPRRGDEPPPLPAAKEQDEENESVDDPE